MNSPDRSAGFFTGQTVRVYPRIGTSWCGVVRATVSEPGEPKKVLILPTERGLTHEPVLVAIARVRSVE